MAMQTALRRAQAQDEAMFRQGGTPTQKSPVPVHVPDRSFDCESPGSSSTPSFPDVSRKNHVEPVNRETVGNNGKFTENCNVKFFFYRQLDNWIISFSYV